MAVLMVPDLALYLVLVPVFLVPCRQAATDSVEPMIDLTRDLASFDQAKFCRLGRKYRALRWLYPRVSEVWYSHPRVPPRARWRRANTHSPAKTVKAAASSTSSVA